MAIIVVIEVIETKPIPIIGTIIDVLLAFCLLIALIFRNIA